MYASAKGVYAHCGTIHSKTNVKINNLRTKKHLSPRVTLGISSKSKDKVEPKTKLRSYTSSSNIGLKPRASKKKLHVAKPKVAEIDFTK